MLEKIIQSFPKYFGMFTGSLTGLTAILTALGYLAEHSHFKMLGFSTSPFDLNQFLITGAMFLAFLPTMIVTALAYNLTQILFLLFIMFYEWIIAVLFILLFWYLGLRFLVFRIWRFLLKFKSARKLETFSINIHDVMRQKGKEYSGLFRTALLFLIVIAQSIALTKFYSALSIENLLFDKRVSDDANLTGFFASTELLKSWILQKSQENDLALSGHMGMLLIITFLTAVVLWIIISPFFKKKTIKPTRWQKLWITGNLILFITQLILLPMNHGVLNLSKLYSTVEVIFNETNNKSSEFPKNKRLILLLKEDNGYYFYSSDSAKVWYFRDKDIGTIKYGEKVGVFEKPDGLCTSY